MEDAHTHILSLPDDPGTAFFGVYDGHGGAKIAQYAGRHLHKLIVKTQEYAEGRIEDALREGFLKIDQMMLEDTELMDELSGTTAVCAILKDSTLYVANVGDSRIIASVRGSCQVLSLDHKPGNEIERERIQAAGGWVEFNRVNGNLALSRALGDFIFKKNSQKQPQEQIVTAFPDIEVRKINEDWEFLVIACDGIWDVMANEEVICFVRNRIASGMRPAEICEDLMTQCLAPDCQMGGLGCDNMTVVIVAFLHGQPYSELSAKCSVQLYDSVETKD